MSLRGEGIQFSPAYPHWISFLIKIFIKTHSHFLRCRYGKKELNLLEGENAGLITLDISESESMEHSNTLLQCWVWIMILLSRTWCLWSKVINFADILKYDYIRWHLHWRLFLKLSLKHLVHLSRLSSLLTWQKTGWKCSFYLLQIKPLVGSGAGYSIDPESIITITQCLLLIKAW